jgi:AcrR family transcriptional regulator
LAQSNSPASITTTDLAGAVGVSQGALFKHFASKEAIWLAVMVWVTENLLRALREAAESADTPAQALRCVFDAHVRFVMTHPGVPRVIFHELQQPEDSELKQQVRGLMRSYRQLLQELLQSLVQCGDAAVGLDVSAATTLFMGIVQGLVMQSLLSGQIANMSTQAASVFDLYLRGIRTSS